MKKATLLLVVALGFLAILTVSAAPASADDFTFTGLDTPSGSVVWNGKTTGSLHGTNIAITTATFDNNTAAVTGSSSGACRRVACGLLTFTTGTFQSQTATTLTFNGGGSVTIIGQLPGDSSNVTLVAAHFVGNVVLTLLGPNPKHPGVNEYLLTSQVAIDQLSPSVMAMLPSNAVISSGSTFTLQMDLFFNKIGQFVGYGENPQLNVPVVVPEPASLMLLGGGLVAIAMKLRKRVS